MENLKTISVYVSCLVLTMMLCACPGDTEDIIIDKGSAQKPVVTEKSATVELTYNFGCEEDLLQFVLPTIVYTDKEGQHELVLDENTWSPKLQAFCYYTVNDTTHYSFIEPDKNGNVPEPWIIESTSVSFHKTLTVILNKVGIENDCIVKYSKKTGYAIDSAKEYDLSRSFGCSSGKSTVSSGGVSFHTYSGINITLGGKTAWKGNEVEAYIEELCNNNDKVTMIIDENGNIKKRNSFE